MSIGFDKWKVNHELLVALTLEEMDGGAGELVYDRAKPHHIHTLHGAGIAWGAVASGFPFIQFAGTPDWVDCPAAATGDLDFVAGNFSLAAWVYIDDLSTNRMVFCRGFLNTDGWYCAILSTGEFVLYTNQVGGNQSSLSPAGSITAATWYLIGATRDEANVRIYISGRDRTDTVGAHTDPITADRELHIGIYDNETGSPFDGSIAYPRIWGRCLPSEEMKTIWNVERHFFNL